MSSSPKGGARPSSPKEPPKDLFLEKLKRVIQYGSPVQKSEILEEVFIRNDPNCTGEMDFDEFKAVLDYMDLRATDEAILEIFKEVDEDSSGMVDLNEFVKFFEVFDEYEKMHEYILRNRATGALKGRILNIYFFLMMIAAAGFTYKFIETGEPQYLIGISVLTFLLLVTLCIVLVWPIMKMRWMKHTADRQRRLEEKARRKKEIDEEALRNPTDFTNIDEDSEEGDLNMIVNEMPQMQVTAGYSYRIGRLKDQREETGIEHSISVKEGIQNDHLERSFTLAPTYADDDLARLAAEELANDSLEAMDRYHKEGYELAKIQQSSIKPSSFTSLGTKRHKGTWRLENDPPLSVQGTRRYVEQSMHNTSQLESFASVERGLSPQRIEDIKMKSTLSNGWYGGSCSPSGERRAKPYLSTLSHGKKSPQRSTMSQSYHAGMMIRDRDDESGEDVLFGKPRESRKKTIVLALGDVS